MPRSKTSNQRWVIIPVEVQVRELLGRLMVAAIAASRGYDVLIGHDRVIRRLARHLPKGILFDKSLGAASERKVARYHRLGYKITAIDEEATGFYSNPELFLSIRLASQTLSQADRWFCISENLRQQAAALFPGHDDKFIVTGLPRTDVWRQQHRGVFDNDVAALKQQHGDFLLFCSNFGHIVHAMHDRFLQRQISRAEASFAGVKAYRAAIRADLQPNLQAYLEMLPKLRQWFPGRKVIVRPHPSESGSFWRDALAHVDGLEVHEEGSATPWILASACLVHHGCTTGIEAELTGRPHVMYAPHPDRHHDTPLMTAFAPIVRDEAGLKAMLEAIVSKGRLQTKDRGALEEYYAALEGKLASERIVDGFEQIDGGFSQLPAYLPWLGYLPRHLFARYWPRSKRETEYRAKKYPGTDVETVSLVLQHFAKTAGLGQELAVRDAFPQLFHVRAKPASTGN